MKVRAGIILLAGCFVLLGTIEAYSDVELYLFPRVDTETEQLKIADIARVVSDENTRKAVEALPVDPRYYADRLVDRSEIRKILRGIAADGLRIYGSAARIRKAYPATRRSQYRRKTRARNVTTGQKVKVVIHRNGIMVQTLATALENGKRGDCIRVKLKDARKIKGRVSQDGDVEVWM